MVDSGDHNRSGGEQQEDTEVTVIDAVWSFLSSMRTAIILLLILAAASVAGTLIEQNQPAELYIRAYGAGKYELLKALGLTDVYHSKWYVLLLVLLGANLAVCSIRRLKSAWKRTFRPEVEVSPKQIEAMDRNEKLKYAGGAQEASRAAAAALRAHSYHVMKADSGDRVFLYAAKGRLGLWGPYFTHLSILVIFAGAMVGNALGFEGYTTITEGKSTDRCYLRDSRATRNLGFKVALHSFRITHDRHHPTGYKSDLRVYERGKQAARKVIDVNHPLSYKGISFFQADYGLVGVVIRVADGKGRSARVGFEPQTRDTPEGKAYLLADSQVKQAKLGDQQVDVMLHNLVPDYVGEPRINASSMPINPAAFVMVSHHPFGNEQQKWTSLGWLPVGRSARRGGLMVTLEDAVAYTGLQVSENPGLPVVYVGFGLMIAGVFASFYIPRRVVRVMVSPTRDCASVLVGAACRGEPQVFERDFERLREALELKPGR